MSVKETIKGQDITARYGGEEFAVGLPNTALRQALTVADHIRRAVMAKELKKKSTGEILGRVTISVGVSMLKPGDDTDSLIERADACLYAPKRNRRNRVICGADPEYAAQTRNHVAQPPSLLRPQEPIPTAGCCWQEPSPSSPRSYPPRELRR